MPVRHDLTSWMSSCPGRQPASLSRRQMLATAANGFGLVALSGLLASDASAAIQGADQSLPRPHFAPRAKNIIFCFMDGGVSHVDSFDPKPKLVEFDGKTYTNSKNPTAEGKRQWLKSPWK